MQIINIVEEGNHRGAKIPFRIYHDSNTDNADIVDFQMIFLHQSDRIVMTVIN